MACTWIMADQTCLRHFECGSDGNSAGLWLKDDEVLPLIDVVRTRPEVKELNLSSTLRLRCVCVASG